MTKLLSFTPTLSDKSRCRRVTLHTDQSITSERSEQSSYYQSYILGRLEDIQTSYLLTEYTFFYFLRYGRSKFLKNCEK